MMIFGFSFIFEMIAYSVAYLYPQSNYAIIKSNDFLINLTNNENFRPRNFL